MPGSRLVIHTEFGIILVETTDQDEIAAAIEAMAAVRSNKREQMDSRNQKNEEAA